MAAVEKVTEVGIGGLLKAHTKEALAFFGAVINIGDWDWRNNKNAILTRLGLLGLMTVGGGYAFLDAADGRLDGNIKILGVPGGPDQNGIDGGPGQPRYEPSPTKLPTSTPVRIAQADPTRPEATVSKPQKTPTPERCATPTPSKPGGQDAVRVGTVYPSIGGGECVVIKPTDIVFTGGIMTVTPSPDVTSVVINGYTTEELSVLTLNNLTTEVAVSKLLVSPAGVEKLSLLLGGRLMDNINFSAATNEVAKSRVIGDVVPFAFEVEKNSNSTQIFMVIKSESGKTIKMVLGQIGADGKQVVPLSNFASGTPTNVSVETLISQIAQSLAGRLSKIEIQILVELRDSTFLKNLPHCQASCEAILEYTQANKEVLVDKTSTGPVRPIMIGAPNLLK